MARSRFEVPTRVLVRQGEVVARTARRVAEAPELVAAFRPLGLDLRAFAAEVEEQARTVQALDLRQESLKSETHNEEAEARKVAMKGHAWTGRLHRRLRRAIAYGHPGSHRYRSAFRLGKQREKSVSAIKYELTNQVYELRRLFEATNHAPALEPYGIDAAFLKEGMDLLVRLGVELADVDDVTQERMRVSALLGEAEEKLVRQLQDWDTSVDGAEEEAGRKLNIRRLDVLDRYVAAAASRGTEAALSVLDEEIDDGAPEPAPTATVPIATPMAAASMSPAEFDALGAAALATLSTSRTTDDRSA